MRRPGLRLVALAKPIIELEKIQQTTNVIEADARATRLLYQQNDAAFATVLEELVTRFDEQLEREKELIRKHENAVESNAKLHAQGSNGCKHNTQALVRRPTRHCTVQRCAWAARTVVIFRQLVCRSLAFTVSPCLCLCISRVPSPDSVQLFAP